jgi:hypothetical protein
MPLSCSPSRRGGRGSFCLLCSPPHPAPARGSWHGVPSPLPLAQGCLLLSTLNHTPITKARPHCQPISSLGNSTFPWGPGSDWLKCLSVSGHPARMQQEYWGRDHQSGGGVTFSINKMHPPSKKVGGGGSRNTTRPWGPTGVGRAARRVGESLPPPPARCCSCKHVSFHVCFPFSHCGHYRLLFTEILQGSGVLQPSGLHTPFSGLLLFLLLVKSKGG